jgi:hypothetical protein
VEPLWDINDLATFLKLPVGTIRTWRKRGYGPRPVRGAALGNHLRWRPETVMAWLDTDDEAA